MNQDEFKDYLDRNKYSYKQDGKWLIIDDNNYDFIFYVPTNFPEYIWFKNRNNVELKNISKLDNIILYLKIKEM